jgi:hypothetical protein
MHISSPLGNGQAEADISFLTWTTLERCFFERLGSEKRK